VKGLGGIFLGLVLVVGIDKLRSSKSMNSK